jgi:hypothetical protein
MKLDIHDSMLRQQGDIQFLTTAKQRVQDCPSFIRHGKQLSGFFLFQFDTERGEPTACGLLRKGGEDIADNRLRALEVLGPDNRMRDITSATAGYQNLCPNGFGPI